jgi:hypothetical protein
MAGATRELHPLISGIGAVRTYAYDRSGPDSEAAGIELLGPPLSSSRPTSIRHAVLKSTEKKRPVRLPPSKLLAGPASPAALGLRAENGCLS